MDDVVKEIFVTKFAWVEKAKTRIEEEVEPYKSLLTDDPNNEEFKRAISYFDPKFENIKKKEDHLKRCEESALRAIENWYEKEEKN